MIVVCGKKLLSKKRGEAIEKKVDWSGVTWPISASIWWRDLTSLEDGFGWRRLVQKRSV